MESTVTPEEIIAIRHRDATDAIFVGGSIYAQMLFEDAHKDRRVLIKELDDCNADILQENERLRGLLERCYYAIEKMAIGLSVDWNDSLLEELKPYVEGEA